jgi:hypothetical protein
MKNLIKILAGILGIAVITMAAMAVFNICPPQGPWPMPPWCSAGVSSFQPISTSIPAKAAPTAEEAPEENLWIYRTGENIILDTTQYLSFEESGAEISWTQLVYPDLYTGQEVVSGTKLNWEPQSSTSISFTADWPGFYRFQLDLTDANGSQQAVVEVPVRLDQAAFQLAGAAMDYWNYSEAKALGVAPAIFDHLKELGIQLVMFSPSWYMPSRTSTEIGPCPLPEFNPDICRGVISDETLLKLIQEAHASGLAVLVKPHLKIINGETPDWPGYMEITDWGAWFEAYGAFVLHYANLAEGEGVEHLSLGNELGNNCTAQTAHWRALIQDVRAVYSGQLSYHDNTFSYEGSAAQFWDDLDYIGVNLWAPGSGAFDVPENTYPDVDTMVRVLDSQLAKTLDPVAEKYDKPVVITEFGTSNYDGSNTGFWEYSGPTDNGEQASFYEAGLRAFASRPFIQGVIIWAYDWEESTPPERQTMSPLDKPAEDLLAIWLNAR